MLDGLARLIEQDEFSDCARLQQTNKDYRCQNDNVAQFVLNLCTEKDQSSKISVSDLYKIYNIWVEREQLRPVSKKVFSSRVADMGYERKKGYINGKSGQSYFEGLYLNVEAEDYLEYALEIRIALEGK
jgi:putative DNA primase/helicase